MQGDLAFHALLVSFIWVPFAVVAGVVDTWHLAAARHLRAELLHPLRALHDYRVAHLAHAHP